MVKDALKKDEAEGERRFRKKTGNGMRFAV
jgi:hypothetical protein